MFLFDEFVEKMYESVISEDDLNRYNGYYDSMNDISTHKEIRKEFNDLKTLLKKTNYEYIETSKLKRSDDEWWCRVFSYGKEIDYKLNMLKNLIENIKDEDLQEEFKDMFNMFFVDIRIDKNNFNQIHIPVGIPTELRGVGVGYKIYKSILKKLNYISSDSNGVVTFYAKNVWNKLRQDKEIYTFLLDKKVMCVNVEYKDIIKLLEKYYHDNILLNKKDNILIDPTFVESGLLKGCDLEKII